MEDVDEGLFVIYTAYNFFSLVALFYCVTKLLVRFLCNFWHWLLYADGNTNHCFTLYSQTAEEIDGLI